MTFLLHVAADENPDPTDVASHLPGKARSFLLDKFRKFPSGISSTHPDDNLSWPKRVLRIDGAVVRLTDLEPTAQKDFVALSYCWGDPEELALNPPLKATLSTLEGLREGISIEKLPLTIQHAVRVCQFLTVGNIWVDSLCIIQDSVADWETEAAKMGSIFARAQFTIIAASAKSCHSGFLGGKLSPECTTLYSSHNDGYRITARFRCISGIHKRLETLVDPVDYRGWTYQEELLSNRYIKFTGDDIQWKCNQELDCLCGQEADQDHKSCTNLQDFGRFGPLSTWERIATGFAARKLTFDNDKLPALSGLARMMAPHFPAPHNQARYLAGLWWKDLVQQLTWYVPDHISIATDPDSYMAPTFSWASLRPGCKLDFMRPPLLVAEALSGKTDLLRSDTDEFGRVTGGRLVLRGPLSPCKISLRCFDPASGREPRFELQNTTIFNDNPSIINIFFPDCWLSPSSVEGIQSVQRTKELPPTACDQTVEAKLLILSKGTNIRNKKRTKRGQESPRKNAEVREEEEEEIHIFHGLVLGHQRGAKVYQRVGMAYIQARRQAGQKGPEIERYVQVVTVI